MPVSKAYKESDVLTCQEVAEYLGVSLPTVQAQTSKKKRPKGSTFPEPIRIGRLVRFRFKDIKQYIERQAPRDDALASQMTALQAKLGISNRREAVHRALRLADIVADHLKDWWSDVAIPGEDAGNALCELLDAVLRQAVRQRQESSTSAVVNAPGNERLCIVATSAATDVPSRVNVRKKASGTRNTALHLTAKGA